MNSTIISGVLLLTIAIGWLEASIVLSTSTITERQGRDVVLSCQFERLTDRDRVMWSKDGVVLSVNQEISGDKQKYEIIGKYDLIIKNIIGHDSGQYLCQNFDQRLSLTIILTVLTRPTKPELYQSNETLVEDNLALFICSTQGGNPLPTFTWLINQIPINGSYYIVSPNTSELRLPLEKRFHNEQLICQVNNKALDNPLSTSRTLNIQYKPEINLRYSQTLVTNLNLLVIENDRLTLDCQIQSNPSTIEPITWLKNGVSMTGINSPSLTLQTIKRSDEGEYTCMTSNSIGRGQASVHIRVQYAPIIRITGGGIISENKRLVLTCIVDAYPSIDSYEWYKNNEKLNISSLTSSYIIDKVSKYDTGIYTCLAKNTLKYSNGSSIEKSDRTQTRVTVEYAPIVTSLTPILAIDLFTLNIKLQCDIDSYPESTIIWTYNDRQIFNSNKYSIIKNKTSSYLIIQQLQSDFDYGFYSCNASNKLGKNSTTIQLRSKGVPETPTNVTITSLTYSSISLKWQPGFDGGWPQSYQVSLNNSLSQKTNESQYTFTNLKHSQMYNIIIRARNRLGESLNSALIQVQTIDVPIKKEDLPEIESSTTLFSDKVLNYRLNNSSFISLKFPLCLRIDIYNHSSICERIVTSSGRIQLNEQYLLNILNVSVCLDQYEDYCGQTRSVETKRELAFNGIIILIASIIVVFIFILFGLCIFCLIQNHKRQRNKKHNIISSSIKKSSPQHPIVIESIHSPHKLFSYSEQQLQSSFSKLAEIQKIDQFKDKQTNRLIVTTTATAAAVAAAAAAAAASTTTNGNFSCSTSGSSDPIISNPNSSSLSGSDQLTVTDFYPISTVTTNPADLSYKSYTNPNDLPLSSAQNDLLWSQSQYGSYGFPFYATTNNIHEIVSNKNHTKEDSAESGYSTPSKMNHQSKKTVYEVVV
ncbi:unnamed protein product [Rotaria sp. Silwood1]|nr:unnamed protein product [Rotaria sp. Silwood1]CAF1058094.1 unnamed protein product [Rotaria sp. Silwood1]CAF3456183.1 unnamed protein product [Rotaria sp. Silwood1]CAF3473361.1 unnamed protein product [Rotaria sp. Silwood1]CAF4576388.1 unnamed protein product [Rotaria sp. Silwood1]